MKGLVRKWEYSRFVGRRGRRRRKGDGWAERDKRVRVI